MNKQKFIDCLRDPSILKESEIEELDQVIKDHPYFQGARALIAKVYKERDLKGSSLKISSAAVYATDRLLLKRYITDHLFILDSRDAPKRSESPENTESVEKVPAKEKTAKPVPVDSPKVKSNPSPKAQQKKNETADSPPLPNPADIDQLIEELYDDMEALKLSRARFQEMEKKLEEDEAIEAALLKAATTVFEQIKEEVEAEEKEIEESKLASKEKQPVDKVDKPSSAEVEDEHPELSISESAETEPTSNSETQNQESEKLVDQEGSEEVADIDPKEISAQAEEETKEEITTRPQETPTESDTLKVVRRRSGKVKSTTYETKGSPKEDENEIISNFISNSPQITRAKEKDTAQQEEEKKDLAEKSSRFKADVASEYLAEIYVGQNKFERAISIYENLSLKFPEKKSFFEARIQELKAKQAES